MATTRYPKAVEAQDQFPADPPAYILTTAPQSPIRSPPLIAAIPQQIQHHCSGCSSYSPSNASNGSHVCNPKSFGVAIPLSTLTRRPAPVDCPSCHHRVLTRCEYETGGFTHLLAGFLCLFFAMGCVPYFLRRCKNVRHFCSCCGVELARWHRGGGGTEVFVFG